MCYSRFQVSPHDGVALCAEGIFATGSLIRVGDWILWSRHIQPNVKGIRFEARNQESKSRRESVRNMTVAVKHPNEYPSATLAPSMLAVAVRNKFDSALLRYDGWFLVFVAVLLGLGATLLGGMAVWCVVNQNGTFTGSWQWASGIQVEMECAT